MEARVPCFPGIAQAHFLGSKVGLIDILNNVAMLVTKTARPLTLRVDSLSSDVHHLDRMVAKRGYSSITQHVIMPNKQGILNLRKVRQAMANDPEMAKSTWFVQNYIDLLIILGEWRLIAVDGKVRYCSYSYKPNPKEKTVWRSWTIDRFPPLARLEYVFRQHMYYLCALIDPLCV